MVSGTVIDPKTKRGGRKLRSALDSRTPITIDLNAYHGGSHTNVVAHINWKTLATEECRDCGAKWPEGAHYGDGPDQCPAECAPTQRTE